MDARICGRCDMFRCRLVGSATHVGNGFGVVDYLIVVECDGKAVAVEAVGDAVVAKSSFSSINPGITDISVESLPDEVKQDYGNAINRIVAKLDEVEYPVNCRYSAEQLVFALNQ